MMSPTKMLYWLWDRRTNRRNTIQTLWLGSKCRLQSDTSTHLMCPKPSSGRYGSFLTWMMESYKEGCRPWATMLARITATIMGRMWEIWPVSSKHITAVDTV